MRKIDSLTEIRQQEKLTNVIAEGPDTKPWLNQAYAEQDIGAEIRNLADRKARGNDGIPGGAYKPRFNGQSGQLQEL